MRKLSGNPRHCNPIRAKYVFGSMVPFCSPLMLRAKVTADAAMPPILLIASQIATTINVSNGSIVLSSR